MKKVDLNADLGESFGAYKLGLDEEVTPLMSSVNIACAWHAGDPLVMKKTVEIAARSGVMCGAHPGFPDLQGFGRRNITLSAEEAETAVTYQMGALYGFLRAHRLELQHVKAHGALYNMAAVDIKLALAIGKAIRSFGGGVIYCGLASSKMEQAAGELGIPFASEVFADRGYMPDGTLVPRSMAGAMITDDAIAARRVVEMVTAGTVTAIDGTVIQIKADTICLHGDNAHAVQFARTIRERLTEQGVAIAAMGEVIA